MYDLKITKHPSYKADGVIVHNCHMMTKDAQNAMLKLLEDAPKNTFFFLATTNPEKLIKPVHSRCTTITVARLNTKKMNSFIRWVLEEELGVEEAKQFPDDVINAVVKGADGACRDALKILDSIMDMDDFDEMITAITFGIAEEGDLKDICLLLASKNLTWKEVSAFISNFTGEPESVRRGILSWFTKMLLSDGSSRTAEIAEMFEEPWFDSPREKMILCLYQAFLFCKA